jgi:hypothetical protein
MHGSAIRVANPDRGSQKGLRLVEKKEAAPEREMMLDLLADSVRFIYNFFRGKVSPAKKAKKVSAFRSNRKHSPGAVKKDGRFWCLQQQSSQDCGWRETRERGA